MRHFFTAAVTAIEAMAIAIASMVPIVLPATLVSIVTLSLNVDPAQVAQTVAAVWGLGHGIPMSMSIDPATAFSYGLDPTELTFSVSLAPLAIGLTTAVLAARLSTRLPARTGPAAIVLAGATAGFAGATAGILILAGDLRAVSLGTAVVLASAWFAVPAWVTFLMRHRDTLAQAWLFLRVRLDRFIGVHLGWEAEHILPRAVKLATAVTLSLIALASTLMFVAIVAGYTEVMSLSQSLQLDLTGVILVALVHLVYLPTLTTWGLSWLSGAGFAVGAGSTVSPFDRLLGPLPALPVFGAIPDPWGEWAFFAPLLITLAVAIVAYLFGRLPELGRPPIWRTVVTGVIAAGVASGWFALMALLASGSIGPGRLAVAGIDVGAFTLALSLEILVGMLIGIGLRRLTDALKQARSERSESRPQLVDLAHRAGAEGDDTVDTLVLAHPRTRIADPEEETKRPWFRDATRPGRRRTEPDPDFSDEALLREYSWEAGATPKPETDASDGHVD